MTARKLALADEHGLWQSFKRQSIQQAVIRLMCRDGLKSVTMDNVAQEAGIAKGTVYLHYHDKQELLDAVKESSLAPMVEKVDEVLHGGGTPERKLQAFSVRYLTYFDEHRDLFRILMYEREVTRVQGSRYQGDRYRHLVQETAKVIREGIRKGSFRDLDSHNVAAMFVESNIAIMHQRLLTSKPLPVEDDAAMIADVFLRGLKPLRGEK